MARKPKSDATLSTAAPAPDNVLRDGLTRQPEDIASIGTGIPSETIVSRTAAQPPALDVQSSADLRHIVEGIVGEFVKTGLLAISQNGNLVAAAPQNVHESLIQANLSLEYVAGAAYNWTASYIRSLPFYIDDVTQAFGEDLYERMELDCKVRSCLNTLKRQTLSHALRLLPAVNKGEDGYELACEICRFCEVVLANLVDPADVVLNDILNCASRGNKVVEQIYRQDGKWIVLSALKPKPRRSAAFVVDVYYNLCGILGLVPGQGAPLLVEGMIGAPDQIPNLLPRIKFGIFTWDQQNGDPRGNSLLRAAYTPWNLKAQLYAPFLKFLCQFASPSIAGFTGPDANLRARLNPDGSQVANDQGQPVFDSPEAFLLAALTQYQNGTVAAFPHGTYLLPIEMRSEGEAFLNAFQFCNREIEESITGQSLATSEGQHQARAASETHQDTLALLPAYARDLLCNTVQRDILRPLVLYNPFGGASALDLLPKVTLAEVEEQDRGPIWTALAALQTSGYLSPSQYQTIDAEYGLPPRSDDDVAALTTAALPGGDATNNEPAGAMANAGGRHAGAGIAQTQPGADAALTGAKTGAGPST